jgi:hypothetical protein
MANIYDLADTWNDGATTFTGIGLDVTDTASASGSLLMDLQVGGSSKFSVDKNGYVAASDGSFNIPSYRFATGAGYGFGLFASTQIYGIVNSSPVIALINGIVRVGPTLHFSNINASNAGDLVLSRDAANTLAQRNSTNPQAFRVYNSYTDGSNYERGFARWSSNVLEIGAEAAGTGTARAIRLMTSNTILKTAGGSNYAIEGGSIIRYASGVDLLWSNSTNAHTGITSDVGILRESAGVLKISDGSTGTGQLIFIVPTSDPGISGALWNNGGTLAISA